MASHNIEMTVDKNMNVDKEKTNNENSVRKDLESGNVGDSDVGLTRVLIMVVALLVLVAACAVTWVFQDWQTSLQVLAILVVVYVIAFYYRWIYIAARTAPRDLKALYAYIQVLLLARKYAKKNWALPDIFHDVVKKHPKKTCFLFEDETWTYQQVEDYSLRVSAVLKNEGVKVGDVVGVMMSNCPEMPATWLGTARLGGVSPLINTNQTGVALLHSINVAKCNYVIYSSEYENAIQDISKELAPSTKLLKFTRRPLNLDSNSVKISQGPGDFTSLLETTPPMSWKLSDGEGFSSKLTYIYTSGTTGLPKAAVITSSRMVFMSAAIFKLGGLNKNDVVYCPMPLYHSAGGVVTAGYALILGTTVALRGKFSASQYFKDCIKYNATAAQYIGEMCRYVLATPPSPTDTQHKVRVVYGNGMRASIWRDFVTRFKIKKVSEFYGATEGNANIVNVNNKEGAIGFISRIIPAVYPVTIIRVDEHTGEPVRNKKGLCMLAAPNEPGVCIGKINNSNPARAFLGYVDKAASDKKIVYDVFSKGDSAFISGDILVADEFGYLYFKDRTGDTFRWRGENVSTTEVEGIISRFADHRDAVVYGVEIPNTDGRAGMCGIVDTSGALDIEQLGKAIEKDLPKYARPIFFRVMTSIDMTGTFKMRKVDLQKEGYDPNKIKDKLFYLDPKLGKYVPLGPGEFERINSGQVRL